MRICLLIVFLFSSKLIIGQDIHFSQFYTSPLNLNPAMTGVMNYSHRLILNYRNQWSPALGSQAYNTSSFSYDTRKPVGRQDYYGLGASMWGDVAGESNLATVQAKISGSYSKYLSGGFKNSSYLVVGSDIGFTQRRISTENLRWPLQHDGFGGWDSAAPSGEGDLIDNNQLNPINYLDISVGLMYFSIVDDFTSYYGGVSFSHINRPTVSFLGEAASIYVKTTIHAGAELGLSGRVSILPNAIALIQGPHREYNTGANIRYRLKNTLAGRQYVQFGAWFRTGNSVNSAVHADALILTVRIDNGAYGIGFSYDATVSEFRNAAVGNGSFELSANYYIQGTQKKRVYCPTF